jgi:hypothetical protein
MLQFTRQLLDDDSTLRLYVRRLNLRLSRRLGVRVRYHVQQLAFRMRLNRLDDPRP